MKLYHFNYHNEEIGELLADGTLVDILSGDNRSRIVYDVEGFLGSNKNFGINYGFSGKKGFIHNDIEYLIDSDNKEISASQQHQFKTDLFFDADKRDSFNTYKIHFESIDEVLSTFLQYEYKLK